MVPHVHEVIGHVSLPLPINASTDVDFCRFLRTRGTYPTVADEDTTMLLSTDSAFFEYVEAQK